MSVATEVPPAEARLVKEEDAAWREYRDAVEMGRPARSRKALYAKARKASDRVWAATRVPAAGAV